LGIPLLASQVSLPTTLRWWAGATVEVVLRLKEML
jgi:hypothetical protein